MQRSRQELHYTSMMGLHTNEPQGRFIFSSELPDLAASAFLNAPPSLATLPSIDPLMRHVHSVGVPHGVHSGTGAHGHGVHSVTGGQGSAAAAAAGVLIPGGEVTGVVVARSGVARAPDAAQPVGPAVQGAGLGQGQGGDEGAQVGLDDALGSISLD